MNVTDVPAERKLLLMGATQESAGSRVHMSRFPLASEPGPRVTGTASRGFKDSPLGKDAASGRVGSGPLGLLDL